jgi:hypothetical protein
MQAGNMNFHKNIKVMKNTLKIGLILLLPLMALVSCKKDDHELGRLLDKSEIKYEVTQDLVTDPGGNTVIMKNLTPQTLSLWDFGTGTSTRQTDTVHFAFSGDYPIKFSAVTAGGVVVMDSVMVKVTAPNLSYVTDQMWLDISGGPGNEKSWVLDTDGKFYAGPMTFINPANFSEVWWDAGQGIYPDNMARGDYGVMTFNLKNGPFFTAVKPQEGGVTQSGTYSLNLAKKRLTITGGSILRGYKPAKNGLSGVNFTYYEIIALDANTLRLGVYRDKDVDGEGNALLVYNFISKAYSDNYVAPASANP